MKYLEVTLRIPFIDLPDEERSELAELTGMDPEDMPTLDNYVAGEEEGPNEIADAIASALDLADRGEMFSGTDIYITIPTWTPGAEHDTEVVSAKWVD